MVDGGLVQFGHSKDDPGRPQIKLMTASLDPLGLPLATNVLSGEQADDGLYVPILDRVFKGLGRSGLLVVGDCKMSAFGTRTHLVGTRQYYLSPLPLTGETAKEMPQWISEGLSKAHKGELESIVKTADQGQEVEVAHGYEFQRVCENKDHKGPWQWQERVLVTRSLAHAQKQVAGLEKRLTTAETKIRALTPSRGRGKRQISEESTLLDATRKILKSHRVEGLLTIDYVKETESTTQYVGRGRGSAERDKQVVEKVRYQITQVRRHDDQISALTAGFGWKAFVTNVPLARLSLAEAVLCYRHEHRVERIFHRLKSRLQIAPLFVKLDDQIEGLTYLLTLGVRVLTVMEFTLRRSLQKDQASLAGLHPENRKKQTDQPSAERVLKAFSQVTLTIMTDGQGTEMGRWLSPLSGVQQDILRHLGLDRTLYSQLEIQNTRN